MIDVAAAVARAADRLSALADPQRATRMAAYLKTDMPCYGVPKPGRVPILRELRDRWPPGSRREYEALVDAFWSAPHREERYLALGLARVHRSFITVKSLPLYRRIVVEGAWWDLVDETATGLIGVVLRTDRPTVTATVRAWIDDPDMWLRRTAIICQIGHKADTDTDLLFTACSARSNETEFFIRKAIGWALREYAKTDPETVRAFVTDQGERLSGLSRREALKHL
jgi:3-methyladenine DNA glycosylase AlkD